LSSTSPTAASSAAVRLCRCWRPWSSRARFMMERVYKQTGGGFFTHSLVFKGWRTQTQRPGLFPKGSVTAAPRKAKSSKACARKPKRARQEVFIECAGVTPLPQFQTLAEASARVHHASCHHLRHCRASRRAPRGACVGRGRVLRHVRHQPCQFPQVRQPPRLQRCARRLRAAAKPMRIPLCAF